MRRFMWVVASITGIAAAVVFTAAGGLPGRAPAQEGAVAMATAQLPADLDRVLRDYETAWQAHDASRLAALFHEDGFVLSSGSPPVRGRAAIAQHYARAGGELHLRAIAYGTQDTIGYIIGAFRGAGEVEGGKFLLALRRANNQQPWLIAADMDNGNSR
jgi:ketosteroid isomerase-like protein